MKRILLLLFFIALIGCSTEKDSSVKEQDVAFAELGFEAALAKAAQAKKMLLIDVFSTT